MGLFRKRKEIEKLKYENAKLKDSLYIVGNNLVYAGDILASGDGGNIKDETFEPPNDFYLIYLTCPPINSAVFKITNWISKYGWTPDFPGNDIETSTTIMRQTTNSLLYDGNAYWDLSEYPSKLKVFAARNVKIEWDNTLQQKQYKYLDSEGKEHAIANEAIIHFVLNSNPEELKGASKLTALKQEIDEYYYRVNASKKKYNYNQLPEAIISGDCSDPSIMKSLKTMLKGIFNRSDIPCINIKDLKVNPLRQDDNLTQENLAWNKYFDTKVYQVYGLSETDLGLISSTRASAEIHEEQTQKTIIDAVMDVIEEELTKQWGKFEWIRQEPTQVEQSANDTQNQNQPIRKGNGSAEDSESNSIQ